MEQIASAGGVTKPILYRHFGDRDGLINAVVERFSADLLRSVTTPLAAEVSARELLRATVDSYVGFIERETHLYRFMVQHPPSPGSAASGMRSLLDRIAHQVALIAATRLRMAGRDARAARAWAHGIVGLVHQAGDWWVDDRSMSRDVLVDDLVTLLWHGLGSRPAPADDGA
jgi:AcrR family transcriptional regulator